MSRPLTPKQTRFVAEYLIDLNATQAYIRAGYSPKAAEVCACQLLRNPKVARAVGSGKAKQLVRAELTADRVLEEMRRLAFVDPRRFYDEHGQIIPIHRLSEEDASALAGIETIIKNTKAGDRVTDEVYKIKFWDKTRAVEMLGKHFKLLSDHVSVTLDDVLIEKLHAGRKRAAAARKP
jgi:phage terminase small subunit